MYRYFILALIVTFCGCNLAQLSPDEVAEITAEVKAENPDATPEELVKLTDDALAGAETEKADGVKGGIDAASGVATSLGGPIAGTLVGIAGAYLFLSRKRRKRG